MRPPPHPGFLAEVYAAHLSADQLAAAGARARDAAEQLTGEGIAVTYSRAIYLPGDETCFYVFEAGSVAAVEAATARAGLAVDRIVSVLEQG